MMILTSKKTIISIALGILFILSMVIPTSAQAKALKSVVIEKAATTYKQAGSQKLKQKLPASVYKRYATKGRWSKLKNAQNQYVWVLNAKSIAPKSTAKYRKMESDILKLVNVERTKRHLPKLTNSASLKVMTLVRTNDMISQNYFGHTSPRYGRWSQFLYTNEYKFSFAGENVASGFLTAKSFVNAWMQSETHRDNILNRRFNKIAITVRPGSQKNTYETYAVQWFAQ